MVKVGDRLEWQGINGPCFGIVAKIGNGDLVVMTGAGKFFTLKDVINSLSSKMGKA